MTERQEKILYKLIEEYVSSGEPISSQKIAKKKQFDLSSATMRNEMNTLEQEGYLRQPHISSGSVPTDKAYRLFVNHLYENADTQSGEKMMLEKFVREIQAIQEVEDYLKFMQETTKKMAALSSSLAITYFCDKDITFKEGWEEIAQCQEFAHGEIIKHFAEMVNNLESKINEFEGFTELPEDDVQVYIGKEIKLGNGEDFSILLSRCHMPKTGKPGILALAGPKRMAYKKNIGLMRTAKKIFEKIK